MDLRGDIILDPDHGTTLVFQLKQQITWLIASGRLKPGDRLPSVQEMARNLGINLHTVRSAYGKLAAEGLLAFHVSNNHLNLKPVIYALAHEAVGAELTTLYAGTDFTESDVQAVLALLDRADARPYVEALVRAVEQALGPAK